jgi:hypothetical protein
VFSFTFLTFDFIFMCAPYAAYAVKQRLRPGLDLIGRGLAEGGVAFVVIVAYVRRPARQIW